MDVRRLTPSEWERTLPDSGREVFHAMPALEVLERHSQCDLRLYAGFNGDRPVGLLPIFVRDGPLMTRGVFSPPPGMNVPHLGPVLMVASPKQSTLEKRNREFVKAVLEDVGIDRWTLPYLSCTPQYDDPRPFEWMGLDKEARFTYHLEVDDAEPDELLSSFSQSRRREIRDAQETDVRIELGDEADARAVYRATEDRFAEEGEWFPTEWEYVADMLATLGERSRVYVARSPEDEFLGGIVALYSNDAAYFWLGGTRTTYDDVPVNSLLHWRIIRDIVEDPPVDSVWRYDMVGAGRHRLSRYKSKFGPELRSYFFITADGPPMSMMVDGYKQYTSLRSTLESRILAR